MKRAILKDALACSAGEGAGRTDGVRETALAPRGEYEIEQGPCCIGLCSCATRNRFSLSFDAFLQHLNEGRITIQRG